MDSEPRPEVLVIGGGFAGLSAATALAERGVAVMVLEARPSLGGRATAFNDPATGERVDNGQHVLFGCYHETFRFLRRLGTERDVYLQTDLAIDIVDRHGHASRLACPRLPAPLHLVAGVLRWRALEWRDRLAVLRLRHLLNGAGSGDHRESKAGASKTDHTTPSLASHTVREWLVRHGQTARLIELLWEPLAVAALNESIDVAAAQPFVRVLRRMFSGSRVDAALALPIKPLDALYATPARELVERCGGVVRTGAPARITTIPQLSVRVRDEEWRPRAIVCAVPWYSLPELFTERPSQLADVLDAAARTAASPIVTVNLWFDRPVTGNAFVGLPGRTMQWVFDKRTLLGETSSHLSLVSSGAGAVVGRTNQEIIELAHAELRAALSAVRTATLRRAVVVREKRATFSVAPGQPPRPSTRTAIPGLFLAGDWIDTGLPATIESAVVSGHWAAAAAEDYLGRVVP